MDFDGLVKLCTDTETVRDHRRCSARRKFPNQLTGGSTIALFQLINSLQANNFFFLLNANGPNRYAQGNMLMLCTFNYLQSSQGWKRKLNKREHYVWHVPPMPLRFIIRNLTCRSHKIYSFPIILEFLLNFLINHHNKIICLQRLSCLNLAYIIRLSKLSWSQAWSDFYM